VQTGDIGITRSRPALHRLLRDHDALSFGKIISADDILPTAEWHISFWSQTIPSDIGEFPKQPIQDKETVSSLVHGLANGWRGSATFAFHGAGLHLHQLRSGVQLRLTFNGEGQRLFDSFTHAMNPYIKKTGFVHDTDQNPSPYLAVAEKDGEYDDIGEDWQDFESVLGQSPFKNLRTQKIPISKMILSQTFYSIAGCCRGTRDIAKVSQNGDVKWLYNDDPFDKSANDHLVNSHRPS